MQIQRKISKDRRSTSRVIALLDCRVICLDSVYDSVILDLSQKGALISCRFLPPTGSAIEIIIKKNPLNKELKLYGNVVRGFQTTTGHGPMGRFGVLFEHPPLDLFKLLDKLNAS